MPHPNSTYNGRPVIDPKMEGSEWYRSVNEQLEQEQRNALDQALLSGQGARARPAPARSGSGGGGGGGGQGESQLPRIGDAMIQLQNNYDTQVFNGDIGHVSSVWQDGRALRFSVRFGIGSGRLRETTVEYTRTALDRDIALSYALTIHKAQGGEYPVVVMPVVPQHRNMLYRNLLYTGLSRAKQLLVMVGSESAMQHAVNNDVAARRVTLLAERVDSREFAPAVTRHMQE